MAGLRALYERALRLGYGLAALGCVPLVMLPLQHTILPLLVPLASMIPRYGAWIVAPATEPAPPPSSLTREPSPLSFPVARPVPPLYSLPCKPSQLPLHLRCHLLALFSCFSLTPWTLMPCPNEPHE